MRVVRPQAILPAGDHGPYSLNAGGRIMDSIAGQKNLVRLGGLRGQSNVGIEDILGGYSAGREIKAVCLS